MDANKIQQIIDAENQARETVVASQAKNIISMIVADLAGIKNCEARIASCRKQLKELTVQTLDSTEILGE